MGAINDPFARCGARAKTKLLLLGSLDFHTESLMNRVRSLNIEHVSPAQLVRPGISRHPVSAAVEQATLLALMRKWFFARKPDAGFVLTGFPATLLQAQVFDEWLDARGECLDVVVAGAGSHEPVVTHYRTLGLLGEARDLAA